MTREEIIAAAAKVHAEGGCRCDRKYLMSCPRMAVAILSLLDGGARDANGSVEVPEDPKLMTSDLL